MINKTNGLLAEAIKTPFIKDLMRGWLRGIDPASGSRLAKTLLWQDVEFILGLLGGLPAMANATLATAGELGTQMGQRFPPTMLRNFLLSLADDIDRTTLRQTTTAWAAVLASLSTPETGPATARALAGGLNSACRTLNDFHTRNPQAISDFTSEFFDHIDSPELSRAATTLANAVLDQKLAPILPWSGRLMAGRVRKRIHGFRKR